MALVLTCTDGSSYAPSICQHAAWAAHRLEADIEVLHVLERHRERSLVVDLSGAIGLDARAELTEELARLEEAEGRVALLKGKAILEEARQQLAALGAPKVALSQRHGDLVETLREAAARASLVVVGKRGEHAAPPRGPLGEHLEELVRVSQPPVLVAARAFRPIRSFLVAFDNSPNARLAVEHAATSPLLRGLECHLVMVGRPDAAHERDLASAEVRLRDAGFHVAASLLPGAPATVIPERVKTHSIDLLVMGAYGHSQIREFILGSTTTTMVRSCPIPVLMFRQ